MPSATSMQKRREIVSRREAGETFAKISRELDVAYNAVRRIYHRYVESGQLRPLYDKCAHTEVRKDAEIYAQAIQMRRDNPTWGAGLIWVELADQFDEDQLPSERTLQRWFHRAGLGTSQAEKRAEVSVKRGAEPHQVWALDAKEDIKLADGSYVSWLTITDEASGAILSTELFPHSTLDAGGTTGGQGCDPGNNGEVGAARAHSDG